MRQEGVDQIFLCRQFSATSGQYYKPFTLVNYDCRVVLTRKLLKLRL